MEAWGRIDHDTILDLYKLHTGYAVYESDSDSSITSSASFSEKNRPPLYTYEELKANLVVIDSNTAEVASPGIADYLRGQIKKELEKLMTPTSCIFCNLVNRSEHDIEHHKLGKTHKKKVDQYIKEKLDQQQSTNVVNRTRGVGSASASSNNSTLTLDTWSANSVATVVKPEREAKSETIEEQKLKLLMSPGYCYICSADLTEPANAKSHYASRRHKITVELWKGYCYVCSADVTEPANAKSHYASMRHKNTIKLWKEEGKMPKTLEHLITSTFCYVCDADLPAPANASSHYNSKRHKNNVCKTNLIKNWPQTIPQKTTPIVQVASRNQSNSTAGSQVSSPGKKATVGTNQNIDSKNNPFCKEGGIKNGTQLQDYNTSLPTGLVLPSKEALAKHVQGPVHCRRMGSKKTVSENWTVPRKIVTPVINTEYSSNTGFAHTELTIKEVPASKRQPDNPAWISGNGSPPTAVHPFNSLTPGSLIGDSSKKAPAVQNIQQTVSGNNYNKSVNTAGTSKKTQQSPQSSNTLSAVLALVPQLDYLNLKELKIAVLRRIGELEK